MDELFDDESTDDEFGVNLQLAERLRIHRGERPSQDVMFENSKEFKQYCNMKRKEQQGAHGGGGSSSSSYEAYNDCTIPETPSPYLLPNKKRQNGDKNVEHLANPKRTCLSDRFHRSSNWKETKKSNNPENPFSKVSEPPKYSYPERFRSERNLSPDKTYERNAIISDDSDSDSSPHFISKFLKKESKISKNSTSIPSSSGACTSSYKSRFATRRGVQFVESDSDESSKSAVQNGALKGGRQSPDYIHHTRKVIGHQYRKVLDSDTDDDSWQIKYRNRPVCFSSSESEESTSRESEFKKSHANGISKSAANHSCSFGDAGSVCPSNSPNHLQTFKPSSFGCSSANSQIHSPSISGLLPSKGYRNRILERSGRTRHSSRHGIAATNFTNPDLNFAPRRHSPGTRLRGRNHLSRGERHTRRSGSPHPQIIHHRSELPHSAPGHLTSPHADDSNMDLTSTYPDLFDAEDSSEVEFFTANSYSDTETSNESLNGLTINATFVSHPDSRTTAEVVCEHTAHVGSSEDEISVIFSTAPQSHAIDQGRGSSRATGRRRYARGTARTQIQNAQDIVSLSPDPVEQVRQMEEDERFARMLQAQFDAEVDPDYTPCSFNSSVVRPFPPSSADSDDEVIDPVGESDSDRFTPPLPSIQSSPRQPTARRGHRIGLYNSRSRVPSFAPGFMLFNNRRPRNRSRNRRRFPNVHSDPWMWQFTRILGISQSIATGIDRIENEYETLLELAEVNGDVQRGLQKTEINRLPTRKYIPPNSASSSNSSLEVIHKRTELNKECQVCLSDYEPGDVLRILPCFHEFHTPCIDPWLKINHTCPVCRVIVDLGD